MRTFDLKLWDFIFEFFNALLAHLKEDDKRHGDTWLLRTRKGQEERIFDRFDEYYQDWAQKEVPIDWLAVAGNAMIAWLREKHPEIWPE